MSALASSLPLRQNFLFRTPWSDGRAAPLLTGLIVTSVAFFGRFMCRLSKAYILRIRNDAGNLAPVRSVRSNSSSSSHAPLLVMIFRETARMLGGGCKKKKLLAYDRSVLVTSARTQ